MVFYGQFIEKKHIETKWIQLSVRLHCDTYGPTKYRCDK